MDQSLLALLISRWKADIFIQVLLQTVLREIYSLLKRSLRVFISKLGLDVFDEFKSIEQGSCLQIFIEEFFEIFLKVHSCLNDVAALYLVFKYSSLFQVD